MRGLIRWCISNTPAMNTLMVGIIVVGGFCMMEMRRELFPEFDLEIVFIEVPYPGASPEEVEEGICQKIEEAVQSIEGIDKMISGAQENHGYVVLELESDVKDVQKVLNEVRSEVDRITSFPELAEDPEVKQFTLRKGAIRLGVVGPESDDPQAQVALREIAEQVRHDLLLLPSVSQVQIVGAKDYQIDVEIPEATLREYGLSLRQVADAVRRENVEVPGGTMRTQSQEFLLRGKNKGLHGDEIATIPLVSRPNGVVLTVGDLGSVRDEFADVTAESWVDGRPAVVLSIDKTSQEDLLEIVREVNEYVANHPLPVGYGIETWMDTAILVQQRLDLLTENGLYGLILVFLILTLFLEFRLAFWVAMGIPLSMLGACAVLYFTGQTMNMLSMFAFIMALGILVDDAIVIGENVFTHRGMGKGFVQAAVDGTVEVLPSVVASVLTTVFAFIPFLFVPGIMGKFIAVMPAAMVAMLLLSLFESTFILPCHLAHDGTATTDSLYCRWRRRLPEPFGPLLAIAAVSLAWFLATLFYPIKRGIDLLNYISEHVTDGLQWTIERVYMPMLRWVLCYPMFTMSVSFALFLATLGVYRSGLVPFVAFPKMDSLTIAATLRYPDGTPASVTAEAAKRLEGTIRRIDADYREQKGKPLVKLVHRGIGLVNVIGGYDPGEGVGGSNVAGVLVELVDSEQRDIKSYEVVSKWREAAGDFPGTEEAVFKADSGGPGGTPIEFVAMADPAHMEELERFTQECKDYLAHVKGVFDVRDDSYPGKWEFQITVKDRAKAMGVPLADLAETVRASYYGEEAMRLQRGRHEVKLMVRYPEDERRSIGYFDDIRVCVGGGFERPLTELAEVRLQQGYSKINRQDQYRSIIVTADVEEDEGNAKEIVANMTADFLPGLFQKYPHVKIRWEGMQKQTDDSVNGLIRGLAVAIVAMFVLLTLEFRSYLQPILVLAIIPFGFVGVVFGHAVMRIDMTLFSLFGLVALTGVVINDSIVLVDFINHRVRDGLPLHDALIDAGRRRFRPVILTSTTTIAGLSPLLVETSFQAQFLIPMATSLCFGLLFTTVMVLVLVPVLYLGYARITGQRNGEETTFQTDPAREIAEAGGWNEDGPSVQGGEYPPREWEEAGADLREGPLS